MRKDLDRRSLSEYLIIIENLKNEKEPYFSAMSNKCFK